MQKVLFVCLGNICRSPSAQGVFEHLVKTKNLDTHYQVDSAATMDYHIGKPPDTRSITAMQAAGIDISMQKARLFNTDDFSKFDHILVMDQRNLDAVLQQSQPELEHRAQLLMNYFPEHALNFVPDPFHGNAQDFTDMVELLFEVCSKALSALEQNRH